jgi:hypothetical protein
MPSRVPFSRELAAELGVPVRATRLDSSPRSRVWRAELPDGRQVIVKQIADEGATGAGGDATGAGGDARYVREVAALRLAARATPAVAPALLAADPGSRAMVLEYLAGTGPPGTGPPGTGSAGDWLPEFAEALARLHALTGPADAGALPAWSGPTPADAESFLAFAHALDVPVPRGLPGELAGLIGRLDPAPHHALLHGDPCPGNDLRTAAGVRFVDFEQASLGNGLVELAYLRIGFPTCWCAMSVAGPPLEEAERAYRTTWRDLTGTDVPGDLADACAGWLIRGDALVERAHRQSADHLARVPAEDFAWGYITAKERLLHRLAVVAGLTRGRDRLPALGQLSAALAARLRARWPTLRPLPAHTTRPWW